MWLRRRSDPLQEAVAEAVAIATLAAQFTAHQAKCIEDKAEIKQQLAGQDAERTRMHQENKTQFDKMTGYLGEVQKENHAANQRIMRYVWMAAGAIATLEFLARHDGVAALLKVLHP